MDGNMIGKNYSKGNSGKRKESDFYETPYSLTRELLKVEKFNGTILEPACGNYAISKILSEYGYKEVRSCDLRMGFDFFKQVLSHDNIITNPPYSKAMEFILKAKQIARKKIIMLLPLTYLHGQERFERVFKDKNFPLRRVYVFTRYPMLGEALREDGKFHTGMQVYAWFVWEKKAKEKEPVIRFIDINKYVLKKGDG
jgi:hypothetical protein